MSTRSNSRKGRENIDRAAGNTQQKIEQTTEKAEVKIEAAKKSLDQKAEKAGEYIDDSVITMKVKTAILHDPILKTPHIKVTTVNGVVKLSGTVDSEQSIGRAMEVANSQKNIEEAR